MFMFIEFFLLPDTKEGDASWAWAWVNACLDGPAIRNANRGRFARIDSQKKIHNMQGIRSNRLKPAIRNFEPPEARFAKKEVQFVGKV